MWNEDTAELAIVCFALELARRFVIDNVHLEGHSMIVMTAIQRRENGITPIHNLYDCPFDTLLSFNDFTCSFVRREHNTVAHMIPR